MSIGIYCIENMVNGKKYIGQSKNIEVRMNNSHSECKIFNRAVKKYGKENFTRYILAYCKKEELDDMEIYYIKKMKSHVSENGYNISRGGNGKERNMKASQKTRKKISKNNAKYWLGKIRPVETRNKISKTKQMFPTVFTEERKRRMSEKNSGKKQSNGLSSIYVGVYKRNDNGKYRSSIKFKGVIYRTGSFQSEEEAAKEYDKLYMKLHKTSSAPNFPNEL